MKKGFTLIEVVVSLSLITILLSLLMLIFSYSSKNFKEEIFENRNTYYLNEALNYIEDQINKGKKNIMVRGNKIYLTYENANKKIIERRREKLIIRHRGDPDTTNNILTGIKDFIITENKNIMYVKITMKDGRKKERCFVLRR